MCYVRYFIIIVINKRFVLVFIRKAASALAIHKETSFYQLVLSRFYSAPAFDPTVEDDQRSRHRLISDFYSCYYYCYYSYTRELSCYSDKMCFVCLNYYLLDTIHVDDGGRHDAGIRELAGLRNGKTVRDEWHGCRNRRVTCDDTIVDGDVLRKALHN